MRFFVAGTVSLCNSLVSVAQDPTPRDVPATISGKAGQFLRSNTPFQLSPNSVAEWKAVQQAYAKCWLGLEIDGKN